MLGCAVAEVLCGAKSPGGASLGELPEGGLQCSNKPHSLKRDVFLCGGGCWHYVIRSELKERR